MSKAVLLLFVVLFFTLIKLLIPSKGKMGERTVSRKLNRLPHDRYKVINNLLINSCGYSTQIDHVVVSQYGVFVIETKNYQGLIYGGYNTDYWTQNIYGNKYELYNPIIQNNGHIKALKRLLKDYNSDVFVSIVAFSKRARLRVDYDEVVYWNKINRLIKSYNQECLSREDMYNIYSILLSENKTSRKNIKEHVRATRKNIKRKNNAISNGYCPICGGSLILRDGKYGWFYGCQNYPKCKYIHKV